MSNNLKSLKNIIFSLEEKVLNIDQKEEYSLILLKQISNYSLLQKIKIALDMVIDTNDIKNNINDRLEILNIDLRLQNRITNELKEKWEYFSKIPFSKSTIIQTKNVQDKYNSYSNSLENLLKLIDLNKRLKEFEKRDNIFIEYNNSISFYDFKNKIEEIIISNNLINFDINDPNIKRFTNGFYEIESKNKEYLNKFNNNKMELSNDIKDSHIWSSLLGKKELIEKIIYDQVFPISKGDCNDLYFNLKDLANKSKTLNLEIESLKKEYGQNIIIEATKTTSLHYKELTELVEKEFEIELSKDKANYYDKMIAIVETNSKKLQEINTFLDNNMQELENKLLNEFNILYNRLKIYSDMFNGHYIRELNSLLNKIEVVDKNKRKEISFKDEIKLIEYKGEDGQKIENREKLNLNDDTFEFKSFYA